VIKLLCVILPNPKKHYNNGELFLLNFDAVNYPVILNSIFSFLFFSYHVYRCILKRTRIYKRIIIEIINRCLNGEEVP
jgi:hypothetical protein